MSNNAYLNWSEMQFEQTGIEPNDFANSGGGGVAIGRKYRNTKPNTPQDIDAYKQFEQQQEFNRLGLQSTQDIDNEKHIDQYIKNCEIMSESEAKAIYLNTPLLTTYDVELKEIIVQ